MITAEVDQIPEVAEVIAQLPGVSEVYSTTGDFDLVAILKVKSFEDIASSVTEHMVKIPGIVRTNTISAFRVYSKTDKEAGFTLATSPNISAPKLAYEPSVRLLTGNGPQAIDQQAAKLRSVLTSTRATRRASSKQLSR